VEPLALLAAFGLEESELLARLDALGHDTVIQAPTHADDSSDDR
jgi:hypothetical protein